MYKGLKIKHLKKIIGLLLFQQLLKTQTFELQPQQKA
jgi:hypothetical protein